MTELHTAHFSVLLGFVLRYVDDMQRAEDVVQETMMRTWRNIDRLGARPDKIRSYLFTVARNVITDQWRADNRRPRLVADDTALASAPFADQVDAAVDGWVVDSAMERLTDTHRTVVESLYFEGRTVAETARRLEVPQGTVKSRAFNAVRALRAAFEDMGVIR